MDLKERIKALIGIFGLSVRQFERECGLGRGNISNMTGALGSDKLLKIIDRYPEVNLYWLIAGEGEMLNSDKKTASLSEYRDATREDILKSKDELIVTLRSYIALQKEQLELLRTLLGERPASDR